MPAIAKGMKIQRIISGLLVITGICLYIFGSYVTSEVEGGRKKIHSAQHNVDTGKALTDLSPYTKDIGDIATKPIQKKIDEGKDEADSYETLAFFLHAGGIVLFVFGVVFLVFSFKRAK